MKNPYKLARIAADELREMTGVDKYDIAVVLGSGWREGAAALGTPLAKVPTSSLSGFVEPTVAGHSGQILTLAIGDRTIALVTGRVHLYEGNTADQVVHPIRTVIAAGATCVVLTNAAGGINPEWGPGRVVVIRDHINLTSTSPMEGDPPSKGYPPRFVVAGQAEGNVSQQVRHRRPS